MSIGKLNRVPLREVWRHEARDFTRWLQDNIDELNQSCGLSLANAEREQSAGDFSVDLIAEDEAGNPIIIENQLERSDHNHLGKLLTYLASIGANTAIWIVADPRSEHISAISWLNESSSGRFYLVKVEAVRIGDSSPAPLLTLIVGPSSESAEVGETKRELAERFDLRYQFWASLLERARQRTRLHSRISAGQYNYISTGAGLSGLVYNYTIRMHDGLSELYIDRGDADENNMIFDSLKANQREIEAAFNGELEWAKLDNRRACRIVKRIDTGGYRDDNWDTTQDAMIDAMIRLEAALRPYIEQLAS